MKHLVLTIGILVAIATSVFALEIGETRWGFDGRVVPGRMNLLSLKMINQTNLPFEGRLSLSASDGQKPIGAKAVTTCYLAPHTSRWIQFTPYQVDLTQAWRLSWQEPGSILPETLTLPTPRFGPPSIVFLGSGSALAGPTGFKVFPEELFPGTVAALDGLSTLVVDTAPALWQSARRKACLAWLYGGGIMHILRGGDGQYPVFTGELCLLNGQWTHRVIGSGLALRHDKGRRELSPATLAALGYPLSTLQENEDKLTAHFSEIFFEELNALTRPNHNWALVTLLSITLILLVGPINGLLGKRRMNYRHTYAFFLITVILFAIIFHWIGARGYGETTAVNTIAYARPAGPGRWTATQWLNVFVTSGGTYPLTHEGGGNRYASGQTMMTVPGITSPDHGGVFLADLPAYSSRAFIHRGQQNGPTLDTPTIIDREWNGKKRLSKLTLTLPGLAQLKVKGAWFKPENQTEDRVLTLNAQADTLTADGIGIQKKAFFKRAQLGLPDEYNSGSGFKPIKENDDTAHARVFERLIRPLIYQALGGGKLMRYQTESPIPPLVAGQLFIVADLPESFGLKSNRLPGGQGRVVYHLTVYNPLHDKEGESRE